MMAVNINRGPCLQFKEHSTGTNNNTELVIPTSLRASYPDQNITPVSADDFDFTGWANSGQADIVLLREDDNFFARRVYHIPESGRLDEAKLDDKVMFGCYRLVWNERTFYVYVAQWMPTIMGRVTEKFFLLSPKAEVQENGYSAATDELLAVFGKWTQQLHEEIYVFDGFDWNKDHGLWKAVQDSSWDKVILDKTTKQSLIDNVHGFFDSEAVYQEFGVPWKRGLIFHGTPGCGKTLTIKALIKSLDERETPVMSLVVKTFEGCTTPQDAIATSFNMARQSTPSLLIFEDLDSLITDKVRSYFLNEVDGLESNHGILIIATTNHLERLDPGISKRPSRFDR